MTPISTERYGFTERNRCPACHDGQVCSRYETAFADGGIGIFVRSYYGIDPETLSGQPYHLSECAACGLVFQKYIGDDRLLSALYTHWVSEPEDPERDIATYRADIAAIRLTRDAHEIMAASSFLGIPLARLRTLDYGMGWALWARISQGLGCASFGTDLAEPRMEFARRHGVTAVTDAEIADLQFDFINTEQVFEHVPQPLDLLRRLSKSLTPGGVIKLSLPSGETAPALIAMLEQGRYAGDYRTIMPIQPLEHINAFRKSTIGVMAGAAGLQIVRPGLRHRYAFLRHRGAIDARNGRKVAKELIRPIYQYRDRSNLFVWLRKAAGDR